MDEVELGDVKHGEVYKRVLEGFNTGEGVNYQYCEVDYHGRDSYFNGYIDGQGIRNGPGTLAWRVINSVSGASEVEFDEGMWKNDKPHGLFHLYRINGFEFKGIIINDKIEGEGEVRGPHGHYQGFWKDNLKHGKGIETIADGTKLIAEYYDDLIKSKCTVEFPNGDTYKGELEVAKSDQQGYHHHYIFSGKGTFVCTSLQTTHSGTWSKGLLDGISCSIKDNIKKVTYEGSFKLGVMHGQIC